MSEPNSTQDAVIITDKMKLDIVCGGFQEMVEALTKIRKITQKSLKEPARRAFWIADETLKKVGSIKKEANPMTRQVAENLSNLVDHSNSE